MATLSNVFSSLITVVQNAVVPLGVPVEVYPGWPDPQELYTDLRNHKMHVTMVTHGPGKRTNIPVGLNRVQTVAPNVQLTAAVSAAFLTGGTATVAASGTITFGGIVGQQVHLIVEVAGAYVPYAPTDGLTLAVAAAGVAAAINANATASAKVVATAVGVVVTVASKTVGVSGNGINLNIIMGGVATLEWKTRQQKDMINLHVWGYDDPSRAAVGDAIDSALETLRFLIFGAEPPMRMLYEGRVNEDMDIRLGVWRRILMYSVEYNQTMTTQGFQILEGRVTQGPRLP
jgi:hypothetical protein